MTDNKLWDTVIEPNMEVELVPCTEGRLRGIKLNYTPSSEFDIVAIEDSTNNIGTNFKKARQSLINKVREYI